MELVAFVGGSLHGTLREIEHNANRLIFPKETYIAVSDDVYILESLDSELSARKGDYQTTKPEETMTLRRNEVAGNCNVNNPSHYQSEGGIECIDAIEASMTRAEFAAHCKACCMKYLWRYKEKGGVESLQKAEWYLKRLIKTEQG